jgi:hypothetical protein
MSDVTSESFNKDTAHHVLTVLRDEPPYRHLRFGKPGTICYSVEILTFPGYLVVVGDMGSFTFRRVHDMFTFFRPPQGDPDRINLPYWHEKLVATDRCDGATRFSWEIFKRAVLDAARQHLDLPDDSELPSDIMEALDNDVFHCEQNEYAAREAVESFEHEKLKFHDFWELDLHEYTSWFIWICYAIVRAIELYDAREATSA